MDFHPLADIFPLLEGEEFAALVEDIRAHGLREPVTLHEGKILDGRNRWKACQEIGIQATTRGFDGDDPLAFVLSLNLKRRHLNKMQRIELVSKLKPQIAAEARAQQGKRRDLPPNSAESFQPIETREKLARLAGVSHDTFDRGCYLLERADGPTKARVLKDETSINAEFTRLKTPERILSSGSVEYYTPARYVEAARRVLGEIDLDPASSEVANRTVRAKRFHTEEDDGLAHDWPGRIWLNPPYCRLAGPFAEKLIEQYEAGITTAAILLVGDRTITNRWFVPLWRLGVVCVPDHRINFHGPEGVERSSPIGGEIFVYLGPHEDRFVSEFRQFGAVVRDVQREIAPAFVAGISQESRPAYGPA